MVHIHWHLSEISLRAYTSTLYPESIQTAVAFIEGCSPITKNASFMDSSFSIRIQMPNFWRGRNFTSNGHSYSSLGLQLRLLTRRHCVMAKIGSIRSSRSHFNTFFAFRERSRQVGRVCFSVQLWRDMGFPYWDFLWVSWGPLGKCRNRTSIRPWPFSFKFDPIHYSSIVLPLEAM